MRVLFTSTSDQGHWRPMLPIVTALAEAGHEVRFALPDSGAEALRARGVPVAPFDDVDPPDEELGTMFAQAQRAGDQAGMQRAAGLGFGWVYPRAALPRLTATVDEFRPDLMVCDPSEPAGQCLARLRDVPLAVGHNSLAASLDELWSIMADPLARLREHLGLDRPARPADLLLTRMPASLDAGADPAGAASLPTARHRVGGSPTPMPTEGRPHVYGTLGTVAMNLPMGRPTLGVLVAALGRLDADATVTTGVEPPGDLPTPAPNVTVQAFAPHDEVIPRSRVVVTHAGAGSVLDAISAGRPIVALPMFADQFANGAAVQEAGVGRCLPSPDRTADEVAAAVQAVLDGAHVDQSRRVAEEVAALPPTAEVVARLEALAT